jgi:hypothetical protein
MPIVKSSKTLLAELKHSFQVLMDYRSTLVDLEKVILKTGDARLSHFQHKIVSPILNIVITTKLVFMLKTTNFSFLVVLLEKIIISTTPIVFS